MIKVVSCRSYHGGGVYIGRPSALGNPFPMKDKANPVERKEVIEKYRVWLREQFKTSLAVKDTLLELARSHKRGEDITLICWCAPLACHGDVIKDAIEKIALTL